MRVKVYAEKSVISAMLKIPLCLDVNCQFIGHALGRMDGYIEVNLLRRCDFDHIFLTLTKSFGARVKFDLFNIKNLPEANPIWLVAVVHKRIASPEAYQGELTFSFTSSPAPAAAYNSILASIGRDHALLHSKSVSYPPCQRTDPPVRHCTLF